MKARTTAEWVLLIVALIISVALAVAIIIGPANAQPRDDFDVWVTVGECSLDVVPSGAALEVTVDDGPTVTIEAPQTIHVDGPATVVVGHRTAKQYDERIYEVPACITTTTSAPPDTTTPPTTQPPTTSTTSTTTTTVPVTSSTVPTTTVPPGGSTTPPDSSGTTTPTPSVPPTTNTPTGDDSSTSDEPILPVTGPSDVLLALGVIGTLLVIGGGVLVLSRAGKE